MFSQASVILSTGGVADTPRADIPLPSACWDTHPPAQCMLGYMPPPPAATAADGTHPTGMHSYELILLVVSRAQCIYKHTIFD